MASCSRPAGSSKPKGKEAQVAAQTTEKGKSCNSKGVKNKSSTAEAPSGSNTGSVMNCPFDKSPHPIALCNTFKKWSVAERQVQCKAAKVCFRCLEVGHMSRNCTKKNVPKCNVNGCTSTRHHAFMHDPSFTPLSGDAPSFEPTGGTRPSTSTAAAPSQ